MVTDYLQGNYAVQSFRGELEAVSHAQLLQSVAGVSAILSLLTDTIDAEVMDAAGSQLKIIANMAVGFDNIDLDAAQDRGIVVTNTPDILTETTADLAFALLLATARRIPEGERILRAGQWKTWSPLFLAGRDVYGKTLGIVGMGRIGEAVARRASGFNMRVLYHNRRRKPAAEQSLGVMYRDLLALMAESDYVVVLVPLTPDTKHLIGREELAMMKPTAVFINVARGPVVDEDALYDVLQRRGIWGAGLDVYKHEPLSTDSPFLHLDNVILLPHIGSSSVETRTEMAMLAARNIHAVLSGEPPLTPVAP